MGSIRKQAALLLFFFTAACANLKPEDAMKRDVEKAGDPPVPLSVFVNEELRAVAVCANGPAREDGHNIQYQALHSLGRTIILNPGLLHSFINPQGINSDGALVASSIEFVSGLPGKPAETDVFAHSVDGKFWSGKITQNNARVVPVNPNDPRKESPEYQQLINMLNGGGHLGKAQEKKLQKAVEKAAVNGFVVLNATLQARDALNEICLHGPAAGWRSSLMPEGGTDFAGFVDARGKFVGDIANNRFPSGKMPRAETGLSQI